VVSFKLFSALTLEHIRLDFLKKLRSGNKDARAAIKPHWQNIKSQIYRVLVVVYRYLIDTSALEKESIPIDLSEILD